EQVGSPADDVVLEPLETGESARPKGIFGEEAVVGFLCDREDVVPGEMDVKAKPAPAPIYIVLASSLQRRKDFIRAQSCSGRGRTRGPRSPTSGGGRPAPGDA